MQAAFVAEDVTSIIKDSIDAVLQNQQYNHFKVATTAGKCYVVLPSSLEAKFCAYAGWSVDLHVSGDLHQAISRPEQAFQVCGDNRYYAKEW